MQGWARHRTISVPGHGTAHRRRTCGSLPGDASLNAWSLPLQSSMTPTPNVAVASGTLAHRSGRLADSRRQQRHSSTRATVVPLGRRNRGGPHLQSAVRTSAPMDRAQRPGIPAPERRRPRPRLPRDDRRRTPPPPRLSSGRSERGLLVQVPPFDGLNLREPRKLRERLFSPSGLQPAPSERSLTAHVWQPTSRRSP